MSAYAILVGFKGSKQEAVLIADPSVVRNAFKDEVLKGSSCKFDAIEVVDTRQGRARRWRNTKKDAAGPASEQKGKASSEPK